MSEIEREFDPEALLENVDGWILTRMKEELAHSGGWEKLANLCVNNRGQKIFSEKDLLCFAQKGFPAETFIEELVKRNVTMKCLCSLLEKAELNEALKLIGMERKAEIRSQSMTGLVFLPVGQEVELKVEANGIPTPTFLWYKGEFEMLHETSNILCLRNFSIEDEGIYLCLVRQTLRDHETILWSSPIQLCVQELFPSFLRHPKGIELIEGEKLDLNCEVEGYPEPCYSWFKDGRSIVRAAVEPRLQLENIGLSDCGVYHCVARNSLGEAQSNPAIIEVRPRSGSSDSPEIVHQPLLCEQRRERSIGQVIDLHCRARCSQNVTFTWVVNGRPLQETSSSRHVLTFSSSETLYNSSLSYTVGEDDGPSLKILCMVQSSSAKQCSDEVKVKVAPTQGPLQYKAGSKWALLVANTDYINPLPPLFTPCSDLERIAKEISDMDFHCLVLTNLNLVELKNAVKLFSSLIKPGDYVIFCYAGHGLFNGVDLLMTVPDLTSTKELEALSSVWIRGMLQRNNPALLFIVLDMCRHVHHAKGEGPPDVIKSASKRNYVILNATSEGFQSLEDSRSSVLTASLLSHLKDKVDVVSMARSVLRDVAHMSTFVRREQIPTLDMDLCDARSLTDPQAFVDREKEKLLASLVEVPRKQISKVVSEKAEVCVGVTCSRGGTLNMVSNLMTLNIEVVGETSLHIASVVFNVEPSFIELVSKREKNVTYEIKKLHKIKEPLVLTVGFREPSGKAVVDRFLLGFPGIARVKIYSDPFDPSALRVKNAAHNIP